MNRNTFFTLFIRVKNCTPFVNAFFIFFLLFHSRMSQQSNLVFRAVPQRAYARQAHLAGNEATPTIAFFDVPTTGMYLDNEPSGEIGFSVKGTRKLLVGNGVRVDGNLIVDGAIIGGDGNIITPIVDFGNVDHNIIPGTGDTYTLGTETTRWSNTYVSNLNVSNDVDILGNLTVTGDTTFQVGFDRVDIDILPTQDSVYSIGSDALRWSNVHANTVHSTNVVTTNIHATTATLVEKMHADDIVSATGNITTFESNFIVSNSIKTTSLLDENENEFIVSELGNIHSNIEPVSNATYSIGTTQNQFDTVHVKTIRATEYLSETGDIAKIDVDLRNIEQDIVPASTYTYSIGTNTSSWNDIWSNTVHTNTIQTSQLLDNNGDAFIPEIKYNEFESNITPILDDQYSLGNSTHTWSTVWASNIYGSLDASNLYGNIPGGLVIDGPVTIDGTASIQDGTEQEPSVSFKSEPGTGIYRPQTNSIGFSVGGTQRLVITDGATISAVFGDASTVYYGDATNMTFPVDRLQVGRVQVTDSNFTPISATAVEANATGYVIIYGASFEVGTIVRFGGTQSPLVTVVDYSEIHATVPPLASGTYDVTVIKDGTQVTLPNGLVSSNIPSWTTPGDLGYVFANISFERQFSAQDGTSSIVYEADTTEYSLPPGTTLTTGGNLSGLITQEDQDTSATYTFEVLARDEQLQESLRIFTLNYVSEFSTGDQSASSLLTLSRNLGPSQIQTPQDGLGIVTINEQSIAPYEVTLKQGDQNVTTFNNNDWFTGIGDGVCSFIKVFGDMNIDAGVTFSPDARKLFTVVHITGNLVLNGTISMSRRGANHGSEGITAATVKIDGTRTISATGTSGGTSITSNAASSGNNGADASQINILQTGGGGSGGVYTDGANSSGPTSGSGTSGTSFSGGSGGGAIYITGSYSGPAAGDGTANGGAGGNGIVSLLGSITNGSAGGGGGNPGGSGASDTDPVPGSLTGTSGTGGILVVIVDGILTGSGTIEARGADGGTYESPYYYGVSGGGGSGGGIAVLMTKQNNSSVTLDASGGAGGASYGEAVGGTPPGGKGGDGGNGSTLVVAL